MTAPADLVLRNAAVHPLAGEDPADEPVADAVAIRDGRLVCVGRRSSVDLLVGVGTEVIDLDGCSLLPGFVDAHTHLDIAGRQAVETDLRDATGPEDCLERLRARRDETAGWVLGFGYDESRWANGQQSPLTRDHLDRVSTDRPVVAFRADLHVASVNSVVLEEYNGPAATDAAAGEPGEGILTESALEPIWEAIRPDSTRLREYLLAAQRVAHRRGITAVQDMVRQPRVARVYRELDLAGQLTLRVRLNYVAEHLDAVLDSGLATNHGSDRVEMGAIKAFADGSLGGRTARLSAPYADGDTDDRGEWVTPPAALEDLVERVDDAGLQMAVHAIGDEAIEATLDSFEGTSVQRHRIEHAEVLTDTLVDRLAGSDVVVSAQPNFLKWADSDGLYDSRLGASRRRDTNRFGELSKRGATLAFGSDCMPLDPLFGIGQAVSAPEESQRLPVTAALRAYTSGSAYAGWDEDERGTIEAGTCADLVALSQSPWETDDLADLDVELTVVDGDVVYDGRSTSSTPSM